ncbi:MAG: hypothetical protein BWY91_00739 [bacterium ADurb.BinA028]|nr:MAG: hypothetical protein BWY91_00739 [bacterium ADurb.BinA028]
MRLVVANCVCAARSAALAASASPRARSASFRAASVARTDTTMSSAKSWKAKNATPVDTAYAIPPSLNVVHNRATTASVWTRTMPTTTRTDTRLARRIAVITNEIEVNPLEEESATTATPSGVTTPSAMARSRLGQ